MKALSLSAGLLLAASVAAHAADSYSFEIDGRRIQIERPQDCTDLSCLSISIPGIYVSRPNRSRARDRAAPEPQKHTAPPADTVKPPAPTPTTAPAAPPPAAASQTPAGAAPPPTKDPAPAGARDAASGATTAAAPVAVAAPASPSPATAAPAPTVAAAPSPTPDDASAEVVKPDLATPVGIWLTEKKEGKIRIEPCGPNLCGFEVDAKSNGNARKVLIDMRPDGAGWVGRIHDPKSGGNYDSTIALKNPATLRVQGCAFGGMFCGGQTWTRLE